MMDFNPSFFWLNLKNSKINQKNCSLILTYFNEWFEDSLEALTNKLPVLNDLLNYLKNSTNQNFTLIKHDQLMISIFNAISFIKE
jgi:hypothetical protein